MPVLEQTAEANAAMVKQTAFDLSTNDPASAEIIVDKFPMSGEFNMAMDAALLELGAGRNVSVIRIYRWSTPTISVGYFQATSGQTASPFLSVPTVRRLSGGGAILHDAELTYSCVLPSTHQLRKNPSELYEVIHSRLIQLLSGCGITCMLRQTFESENNPNNTMGIAAEPFLCFLRSNPNDIVDSSGAKIVGSAQRRRKGITLQHGSILLSASTLMPTIPGIRQLCPRFDAQRFQNELPAAIGESVSTRWEFRDYDKEELEIAGGFLKTP